jgi:hypothetical protein
MMVKCRLLQHRLSSCAWAALLLGAGMSWLQTASAQEVVYRCGNEYTNAPRDIQLCERMAAQAVTVITGTRPAPARVIAPAANPVGEARSTVEPPRGQNPQQVERDLQARTIVSHELDKARQQLTLLVQEYNDGEPVKWASESRHHQRYLDRVASLKSAIERTQRDIDSLQRELDRRPVVAGTRTP